MHFRLTVRAAGEASTWQVDEWTVLVALGALAAEPETLAEFYDALRRYQPNHRWDETGQSATGGEESAKADGQQPDLLDGHWFLIDLSARSAVAGGEFALPELPGAYQAEGDDELAGGFHLVWIETPLDWSFEAAQEGWQAVLDERRKSFESRRRVDARGILFGRGMLEFVASRVLAVARADADKQQRRAEVRAIHADWLLTVRDDLAGRCPREVLLCRHKQIGADIEHRAEQWTKQGFAPPALNVDSAAYRFGGFGTIEIVLYFDLVRALLYKAWTLACDGQTNCEALVEQLAAHRDAYLDQPPEDDDEGRTCNELIELERRRMPITSNGGHLDCDCPICRAQAEGAFGSGPMFTFYDGLHLETEDEFAFSLTESREEWELEQGAFACLDAELDYRPARPERKTANPPDSVWKSSSVDWESILVGGKTPVSAKLAIGFPLAEIVSELRERDAPQVTIDELNDAFTLFRRADDAVATQSAAEELRARLEQVAGAYPELVARSADLQSRLDEVLRGAASNSREPNWPDPGQRGTKVDLPRQTASTSIPPLLNVVVYRAPGPADVEIEPCSAAHVEEVSPRPLAGGLGYLTLETDDFDRLSAGVAAGDATGTAAAALHFLGPEAQRLIGRPRDLGYFWTVTEETEFGCILLLQVASLPSEQPD